MIAEHWVCEFSPKQCCYHIAPISEMIRLNQIGIFSGDPADYLPFAICETEQEADKVTLKFQRLIEEARLYQNNTERGEK